MIDERGHRYETVAFTLLRVIAGLLFMEHGAQKLLGWFGGMGPSGGTVQLMSQFGLAGVIELVGGALLVLGLGTRIVALLASGEMAVAYFQVHAPNGFWPLMNKGELPVLYCFVFLYLAARGAGPFSLDAMIRRSRESREVITAPPGSSDRAAVGA